MRKLSPKLPVDFTTGTIESHLEDGFESMIKQNLKMILLTHPGERIMVPDFGVGLRRFIFELETYDDIYDELIDVVSSQVSQYFPVIQIINIWEDYSEQNYLRLTIDYNIDFLNTKDSLDLLLETY